jgi:hypothetical protein
MEIVINWNCHSPTQTQQELELDIIIGMEPNHISCGNSTETFKALAGNLGS